MQERCITYTVGGAQAEFIHMKSTSKKRTPSIVNLTVQATLSHRARGRAADELCPQVWPLRASRRDHDPGGLPPWPAGVGGLREGCTFYTSQVRELSFLHSRDVTYAVFCQGPYE